MGNWCYAQRHSIWYRIKVVHPNQMHQLFHSSYVCRVLSWNDANQIPSQTCWGKWHYLYLSPNRYNWTLRCQAGYNGNMSEQVDNYLFQFNTNFLAINRYELMLDRMPGFNLDQDRCTMYFIIINMMSLLILSHMLDHLTIWENQIRTTVLRILKHFKGKIVEPCLCMPRHLDMDDVHRGGGGGDKPHQRAKYNIIKSHEWFVLTMKFTQVSMNSGCQEKYVQDRMHLPLPHSVSRELYRSNMAWIQGGFFMVWVHSCHSC
jgi:hypothetical protein